MPSPQRPTLSTIAARIGVSEMTVSRALRGSPDVSEKTSKRVQKAARELGYLPNKIAGSLAKGRVDLIGVIVPSLNNYVFNQVLRGICDGLEQTGLRAVFGISDYLQEREESVIAEMLAWRPRGLIVTGLEHSDGANAMLHTMDIPLVEIMDSDSAPINMSVGISHTKAGRLSAEALIARGYSRIGFIGTKMKRDFRAQKRLDGLGEGLKTAKLDLVDCELYRDGATIKKGRELTAELLTKHPDLDCIVYSSDVMSIGGLMHCLSAGISVPDQLGLIGFNQLELLEGLPISLASINSYRYEIGLRAAQMIMQDGQNPLPATQKIVEFEPEVLFGESL